MDRVSTSFTTIVTALLSTTPLHAQQSTAPLDRWAPIIEEAATRFGIPTRWIREVMTVESGGRTDLDGRPITSPKGAMGLMQIMPQTYADLRLAHDLGADPYEPRDNIFAGAAYLKAMHDRFGWPSLFAAYNAGPARYEAHLRTGQALPDETVSYLAAFDTTSDAPVLTPSAPRSRPIPAPETPVEFASGRSIFFVRNSVRVVPDSSAPIASSNPRAAPIFVRLSRQPS